ncbi:MAG: hypothetical protein AB8G05_03505 [Oligoflexales bacterium]
MPNFVPMIPIYSFIDMTFLVSEYCFNRKQEPFNVFGRGWDKELKLTEAQLVKIVDELIDLPPEDEASFEQRQHYLDLALDDDQKAEICLLCAEKESEIIGEYLKLEVALANAEPGRRKAIASKLKHTEGHMLSAAKASLLTCMVEDHRLRGNIRYLKRHLEGEKE